MQQRNGRKTVTTVQGLPDQYDPKKLLKAMKKKFACIGHVIDSADSDEDESPAPAGAKAPVKKAPGQDFGKVLQFSGDQRNHVKEFLVEVGVLTEKEAKERVVM